MGNKHKSKSEAKLSKENINFQINRNHFEFLYVIGRGGFGKVWKVQLKKYKLDYATKEMLKAKVIDKHSEESIINEKEILSKMRHPFIVNSHYAFQDISNLYLILDYLSGGDLRYHISRIKKFNEEQTKFFVGCIILALEYMHSNNILHRDLKPENLVLDSNGYARITDFGVAKVFCLDNAGETSGTPGYMAPEVMCGQNHTTAVDYYALGVISYEFMLGYRPYVGKSRKEIKEKILAKQVAIKKSDIPEGWSLEAADFINRLIQRKTNDRLGMRGIQEVKEHVWLKFFPWKEVYQKKYDPPFKPKAGDNFDVRYCNTPDVIGNRTHEKYEEYLKQEAVTPSFNSFYFYRNDIDEHDCYNSKVKLYSDPHWYLVIEKQANEKTCYISKTVESEPSSTLPTLKTQRSASVLEEKFNKIKKLSNSGSAGSLYNKATNQQSLSKKMTSSSASGSSIFKMSKSASTQKY